MKLDFFRELKNNLNNNEVKEFISELSDYLENFVERMSSKFSDKELSILEEIQKENNVSIISENKMRKQAGEIIKEYANKTSDNGEVYFVSSKSKSDNKYIVFKYENNKESTIKLTEDEVSRNFGIDSILRKENGQYILDKEGTEYAKNEIRKMANKILEEQNRKLGEYRREGHLYMVEEDVNNRIYLKNLTSRASYVFEEVSFPKQLINIATEGTVFKYENGDYTFYSRDGFERVYEE